MPLKKCKIHQFLEKIYESLISMHFYFTCTIHLKLKDMLYIPINSVCVEQKVTDLELKIMSLKLSEYTELRPPAYRLYYGTQSMNRNIEK